MIEVILLILWLVVGTALLMHIDDNTRIKVRGRFKRTLVILSGLLGATLLIVAYLVGFVCILIGGVVTLINKDGDKL
jgi:hypothetical protein